MSQKKNADIAPMIRESDKDSVTLTIQRAEQKETSDIKVEIRDVEIQTVSHEMLDDETGYIRISEFSEVTSNQYKKAFEDLHDKGMKKLVVDLRNNPGGLLNAVCDVLRQILPEGLIVYTEDKNGKKEEEKCDGKNELNQPLAVLVNGSSASASEIFAGASKGLWYRNDRRNYDLRKRCGADHPAAYRWQCGKDHHCKIFHTKRK